MIMSWIGGIGPPYFSADAAQYLQRLWLPATSARAQLNATLIDTLVSNGLWTKLDALYLGVSPEFTGAMQNVIADKYQGYLQLGGGVIPTFTTDRGFTGAGINQTVESLLNPSLGTTNYSQNSATVFAWSLTNTTGDNSILIYDAGANQTQLRPLKANGTTTEFNINSTGDNSVTLGLGTSVGLWCMVRETSTVVKLYYNGSLVSTVSQTSAAITGTAFMIPQGPYQCAYCGYGSAFGATDVTNLYNALFAHGHAIGAL